MDHYLTAQICLNGHCILPNIEEYPAKCSSACSQCGAKTITACPQCGAKIRGYFYEEGTASFFPYETPLYCHNCGEPYPWLAANLEAASEIIEEDDLLSAELKRALISSLPDTVAETPRTNLAVIRLKRALLAAGKFTVEGIRQFLVDCACEIVKQQIF